MRVKEWMSASPTTTDPKTSMSEARELMRRKGIRHLLVTEGERLVGIVTDRDLRRPKLSDVFKSWDQLYRINDEIQVEDIMASPALTIPEEATIQEAAKIMANNRIGALPVTDKKGKLDGVITESDILRALAAGKK